MACTADDIQALGLSCSAEEPCPVFVEFAAVDGTGDKVVLAGNLHTANVTLSTLLLLSNDAGATWTEPHPRIKHASFDHAQVMGFDAAWAGGQVLFPLPRDPFVLSTEDGGKTWQRRTFAEEGPLGALDQMWFESRTNGQAVIKTSQRYQLFATQTGGSSWTPVEIKASPIRLKQERPEPAWRTRADGPSKTVRVERRDGTRWVTAAVFPVQAGVCKPEPEPNPGEPNP